MKISIVAFDDFTDIDVWFMWDLLNRVERPGWQVQIIGERCCVTSSTGIRTQTHARLDEANTSDAVLFASGKGTRAKMDDHHFLDQFDLDPERQLIGSMCSGALLLAALGLLEGKRATTYPTSKELLETMGVRVIEAPFVREGNVATAAGCLAAQHLVGWVIEELLGRDVRDAALKFVQPVGEGLTFDADDYEQALAVLRGAPQIIAAEASSGALN